jgi:hypothetical protein
MTGMNKKPAEGNARRAPQSRVGAGGSFAVNRSPSVAVGHHAAILQPPPIIAGLPSAVAWSHPTAEGVPSTAEGRPSAIGWVPSAIAWVHSTIHWLPSIAARGLAMAERRQSALIHAIFAKKPHFGPKSHGFGATTKHTNHTEFRRDEFHESLTLFFRAFRAFRGSMVFPTFQLPTPIC